MKKRILLLCLFCMTLGFAYSQKIDSEITNMSKTVISTSGKKSLIKAENLKKAWTPSYIHVISISPKANLFGWKNYCRKLRCYTIRKIH